MAALFGTKGNEVKATEVTVEATAPAKQGAMAATGTRENIARVLKQPRITEKATLHTDKGVYVFNVAPDATKKQIKEAIYAAYKVTPKKVHVSKIASKKKRNMRTGIKGVKSGGKKAYVYLKKGDSISIM